ncbi:MAG: carboxy terminal-processing peptidase [Niabella sp.]
MKRFPFVILILVAAVSFVGFKMESNSVPPDKNEKILRLVGEILTQAHFSPQPIDDSFSEKVFNKFIEDLDREKNIFLKSDIEKLKASYAHKIDDEIKGAPIESFYAISKIFDERMQSTALWPAELLKTPYNYKIKEDVTFDGDKLDYVSTEAARKERWQKKIKYLTLERYVDMLDEREANKKTAGYVAKSDEQLEKDARAKTDTLMQRFFNRYKVKLNDEDKFSLFVNAITTTMDPHTAFFPPVDKRYFDEEMSGSFFGIGAGLQERDGEIRVISVNVGSPAALSGEIKPGDIISKVGQGNEPQVDLLGYGVQDAVKLIRGKEGTIVSLTLKKPDGTFKVLKLKRAKIENEDTFARSAIIKDDKTGNKIGMIYLPEFYASFDDPNGRRSYLDVAKEIKKLKAENVSGIIMDLRRNGGGSLYDVVQMVGLFVGDGPVVQVKDRINKPQVIQARDEAPLYTGPLAVMVDEFSASASEIFAAAIQDYGRGIIIGSTSTYGKGTVQRNIGLDEKRGFTFDESDLGTVKLTLQKYYRISGGSTQLKGVESDVVLPSQLETLKIREKDDKDALPYDEIAKADYQPVKSIYNISEVKQLSRARVARDSAFVIIKNNTAWLTDRDEKSVSLNIDDFKAEKKIMRTKVAQIDSAQRLKTKLDIKLLAADVNKLPSNQLENERVKAWLKALSQDIYLDQAVKVVDDMIGMETVAKSNQMITQDK